VAACGLSGACGGGGSAERSAAAQRSSGAARSIARHAHSALQRVGSAERLSAKAARRAPLVQAALGSDARAVRMAYAVPLSGDDLPRRRRVAGRTSTLQLGEDEPSGVTVDDVGMRRGGAPAYPAEPAGGGYFGPDPTPVLSQKERLAAERKVRGLPCATARGLDAESLLSL
jgi:hypothetical protein